MLVPTWGSPHPGWPVVCVLTSHTSLDIEGGTARGRLTISAGTTAALALRVCSPWEELPAAWSESEILRRLDATVAAWRSWSELHQRYEGPYTDLVGHSGRVLQALT